jgi:hypothetical protein
MKYQYPSHLIFFSASWSGVRLSPVGTSATNWPIVPAPDDRWVWSSGCPTGPDLGSNKGRRDAKPATNRLTYVTALSLIWLVINVSVALVNMTLKLPVPWKTGISWMTKRLTLVTKKQFCSELDLKRKIA